jgi:hypothetical protein
MDYHPLKNFLRRSAGIDIDKSDVKQLNDLIGSKLNDLLVIGARNASYNGRDIVMEPDLPLAKVSRAQGNRAQAVIGCERSNSREAMETQSEGDKA